MSILRANYEEVLRHLRDAHQAMRHLMAVSGDWTAKVEVEEEFRNLRDTCREFARHHYGIDARRPAPGV
jgi:hypothetical protein